MTISRRTLLLGAGGLTLLPALTANRLFAAEAAKPAAGTQAFTQMRQRQAQWLKTASGLIPVLKRTPQQPLALVKAVPDAAAVLRYRMETEAPATALGERLFKKGDQFILDFGGHRTGHLEFDLIGEGKGVDAPVRLKLTFGEVPTDIAESFTPYTGQLATGWLPDEIINVDYLPQTVKMPRRYAFRYVKVEIIDTSSTFEVRFRNVRAIAISSVTTTPKPLNSGDPLLDRIDAVSMATLRDCMQTVFEDGPRRDQRLWIGDLRLQALSAYATFGGERLVKRCLYMFAAFPRAHDGFAAACIYEKPLPRYGGIHIHDYAALYNVTLCDYVRATGDLATAADLWPVAVRQVELLLADVKADGIFVDPGNSWLFIDWADKLDRLASLQGVLIYAFERTLELARTLKRESDLSGLAERVRQMRSAAYDKYFDTNQGVFVSGAQRQVSWASQAWMAIANVARSKEEGGNAILRAMAMPDAVKPVTPYLYHYVVEGLLESGKTAEALKLLKQYWGGMVEAGADTFWEVYEPGRPLTSPYGDVHINSFCHAWSCTPSYLLRTRGLAKHRS